MRQRAPRTAAAGGNPARPSRPSSKSGVYFEAREAELVDRAAEKRARGGRLRDRLGSRIRQRRAPDADEN